MLGLTTGDLGSQQIFARYLALDMKTILHMAGQCVPALVQGVTGYADLLWLICADR